MLNESLLSVFGAAGAGLAYMAVRYPRVFNQMFGFLLLTIGAITIIAGTWRLAGSSSFKTLMPYIPADRIEQASVAHDAVMVSMDYVSLGALLAYAYLFLLLWVSGLVEKDTAPKP
jgi:hypothetical protein